LAAFGNELADALAGKAACANIDTHTSRHAALERVRGNFVLDTTRPPGSISLSQSKTGGNGKRRLLPLPRLAVSALHERAHKEHVHRVLGYLMTLTAINANDCELSAYAATRACRKKWGKCSRSC
jgi:hypothetical protein